MTTPWPWRALRTTAAATLAVVAFAVGLTIAARTADDPPRLAAPSDAGAAPSDAGPVDAGEPTAVLVEVTVPEGEDAGPAPDAGPPGASLPPYDVRAVAMDAATLVETCAKEALRWDLSLGGPFALTVRLPASDERDEVLVSVSGLTSPVLESCLARRRATLPVPAGAKDLDAPQAVVARGVLKSGGAVTIGDEAVVAVPRVERAGP